MKLFKIRGGVHPDDRKSLSAERAIEAMPLAGLLHIPAQQHIGAVAKPAVHRGQRVLKGEVIATAQGAPSAPIHAPTSGRIVGIGNYPANHPSGLSVSTISLQPDGEDRWSPELQGVADPFALEPAEVAERVAQAGVVGMGGATFPSAIKLNLRERYSLTTLVINGAECEPYLTCDDRLMRERAEAVIDGVRIMAHALGVQKMIVAIENNKPQALAAMEVAAREITGLGVVGLPTRYPMGSEKHLVQTLTGQETPARALTADIGVVVHNVATAYAVHQALRLGQPLVERVVTVSGSAIRAPANLSVAIGTPVSALIDYCGGFTDKPARLLSGGPMMGQPLPSLKVPIVKGCNGILALNEREAGARPATACIRCGNCVEACPCGLVPLQMAALTRAGELEACVRSGLMDCIGCGSCAYVCPARIPLVQYFNYAKGEMAQRARIKHKQNEIRILTEQRSARMEAQKQAKRAAMAKAKARQKSQAETTPAGETAS